MNERVDMGNAFVKGGWEIGAGGGFHFVPGINITGEIIV